MGDIMNIIENMPYDKNILYDDSYQYNGLRQRIYMQKAYMSVNNQNQYFFKSYVLDDHELICQGYIYFYLNKENKASDFIGAYIKPEYRNDGIASLLVSTWIQFCLNNGYNFLGTNKAQRKPFLLYLLKTYGFEIMDSTIYQTNPNVIDICKSEIDNTKYLLFKNPKQKISFLRGNIAKGDNYSVIDSLSNGIHYLDSVILSKTYSLINEYKANEKSILVLKRYKR